ncbi:MAG: DUF3617 domain-containing protein [Sphingomonadales bacterium]|nr:DUF3617 domain-containing protein [Sphingomonadales bacterium]
MTRARHAVLTAAAALAILSLAACKKDTVVAKNESVEAVASQVAASSIRPQPGRWESNMKLDKFDLPNMPPQAKAAMNRQMGVTQTFASCLTPEEANRPGASFFQKGAENCKYEHFVMAGGKLDAAMVCKERQTEIKMTMAGSYSETEYNIQVKSQGEMQPGMPMAMDMTIASHRVGECNGTEGRLAGAGNRTGVR